MSAVFSRRPWGRNECVTNEPHRTSAGRLGAHIVSSMIHRWSTSTVRWPHMLLLHWLQQALKVMSIRDKIQRSGTAQIETIKITKTCSSIFFITQHQLSIFVKHKQKEALIWLQNGKIPTVTPTPSLQWILEELSNVFKGFIRRLRS